MSAERGPLPWTQLRVLHALKEYLRRNPEVRITQALWNVGGSPDPFYITDDQLADALEAALRE